MKKKNFDPDNYNKLNNLRSKVIKDVSKFVDMNNKKILEVGTGTGDFSKLLSKKYKNSYIYGIDIVPQYIESSQKNNTFSNLLFETKNIYDIDSTYDVVFMLFSLTELLKNNVLEKILNEINKKILCDGYLVIVDEFTDDYTEKCDLIGIEVMQELGYKYLDYNDFKKELIKSEFELVFTKIYENKQKMVDAFGAKLQIFYENKLNEFDNTKKYDSELIWKKMEEKIKNANGIRTYNKSRLVVLKHKNNIITKLSNQKSNLCLYYSLHNIKNNIKYYKDLKIKNLEYIFPVKTFPNSKVLDLFYNSGFYYDVSNKNEENLVKKYKNLIFYSDPTNKLKNNNAIRLYVNNLGSHFGFTYDGGSYAIYHIHISLNKSKNIQKKILKIISHLDYSKTKYLDIGGSYDSLSYLELYFLLKEIRNIVPRNVKILIEAGSMWFKNSGFLISKVEYINLINQTRFVYVNASRELHTKWSIPKYINTNIGNNDYIICGSTCYEKDLFSHVYNTDIKSGARIYFGEIEPYSYSFNISFNGIEKAEVIIDE